MVMASGGGDLTGASTTSVLSSRATLFTATLYPPVGFWPAMMKTATSFSKSTGGALPSPTIDDHNRAYDSAVGATTIWRPGALCRACDPDFRVRNFNPSSELTAAE